MTYIGTSANGWKVYDDTSNYVSFNAGGRDWWAANKSVATVMKDFIDWYAVHIEPIVGGTLDDWSRAVRAVRDQTTGYSNHASCTAWDINALKHVRGVHGTYTAAQVKLITAKLNEYDGVIRWGRNYTNATVDDMHYEINTTPANVFRLATKIEESMPTPSEIAEAVLTRDSIPDDYDPKNETITLETSLHRIKNELDAVNAKVDQILTAIAITPSKKG